MYLKHFHSKNIISEQSKMKKKSIKSERQFDVEKANVTTIVKRSANNSGKEKSLFSGYI